MYTWHLKPSVVITLHIHLNNEGISNIKHKHCVQQHVVTQYVYHLQANNVTFRKFYQKILALVFEISSSHSNQCGCVKICYDSN